MVFERKTFKLVIFIIPSVLLIISNLHIKEAQALSCMECDPKSCPDLDPVCCFSGLSTNDVCGCCKSCTKRRGDRCGRIWMIEGKCGADDVCLQMLQKEEGKTEQQIKDMMENDGNGTCYDKTRYQNFMNENQDKYVMQVKEGGSATDAVPISDCATVIRQPARFQELKNKGGYAAKGGTSKCDASKRMISEFAIMSIFFHLYVF